MVRDNKEDNRGRHFNEIAAKVDEDESGDLSI